MFRKFYFFILFFGLFFSCSKEDQKEKKYIVAMYNLKGDQAVLDVPSYLGAKLAFDQVKKQNKEFENVFLVLEDGFSDVKKIQKQAKKWNARSDVIAFIGFSDTNMVLSAAEELKSGKKVFITSGATSPLLAFQGLSVFLACFSDETQAEAGAEFAYEKLKAKNVLILYDEEMEYTKLLSKYFAKSFEQKGGKILQERKFSPKKGNFQEEAFLLKKDFSKADLIYLAVGPTDAPLLIAALRNMGWEKPLLGGDSFDFPKLLEKVKNPIGDIYFTTHAFLDKNTKDSHMLAFIKAYEEEYKSFPDAFAALGYDAMSLLADAMERNSSSILEALYHTKNFCGVTGTLSYDNKKIPRKTVFVLSAKKEGKKLAFKYRAKK